MPNNFQEDDAGLLFIASGFDPMMIWDGLAAQAIPAGLNAPSTGIGSLTGGGAGAIVGTYNAYLRFVDALGNFSNFSPISSDFIAGQGVPRAIDGATNATPIEILSPNHGLTTGTIVQVSGVGGNTAANGVWTMTVVDANNFTLDTSSGDGTYTGYGFWIPGLSTIVYNDVPTTDDPKVARRQILRNTSAEETTYYLDVDTQDMVSTTFQSTLTDEQLLAQPAQPILDQNNAPLADQWGIPPSHKAAIAFHLGRMFAAVEYSYTQGMVVTTFGSFTVFGIGTEWTLSMANRYLYVGNARNSYQIAAVDPINQILTLTAPYQDLGDSFGVYAIRPAPAERRLIYYSQAGLSQAWPPSNSLSLQEDGDEITGLMQKSSFCYFLERNHIYRFTFQTDPAVDGFIFLSCLRGCVNQRCWVSIEDTAYMLDEQGIHAFSGGEQVEAVSTPIQEIFRPTSDNEFRINWAASQFFHCLHFPSQEVVRWFVAMSGQYMPHHAIAYNYRTKRWWLEQFDSPVGSSVLGRLANFPQPYLGLSYGRVVAFWQGTLDGPNPADGTVQGTATSASTMTLTDDLATFPLEGLVGNNVVIIQGTGKGQTRPISTVSGNTIRVKYPWTTLPDTTSVYQLGGVAYRYQTGWFRFAPSEEQDPRRIEIVFEPVVNPATIDLRLYLDWGTEPMPWRLDRTSLTGQGVQVIDGSPDLIGDLTKPLGFLQKGYPGHKEFYLDGPRFFTWELRGYPNTEQVIIYYVTIDGAVKV